MMVVFNQNPKSQPLSGEVAVIMDLKCMCVCVHISTAADNRSTITL